MWPPTTASDCLKDIQTLFYAGTPLDTIWIQKTERLFLHKTHDDSFSRQMLYRPVAGQYPGRIQTGKEKRKGKDDGKRAKRAQVFVVKLHHTGWHRSFGGLWGRTLVIPWTTCSKGEMNSETEIWGNNTRVLRMLEARGNLWGESCLSRPPPEKWTNVAPF